MKNLTCLFTLGWLLISSAMAAEGDKPDDPLAGFKWREIGPALMSGRIADIAFHPEDPNTWYIGVGSGGVWKTVNAGTTWTPVFDKQPSYSIGTVVIDPADPNVIWVGTGENVGGRHVGYGDGIYRSADGGATWEQRGLEQSEHISKILIHPEDSNTLYVASQGPLWSRGGDRGLFKTTDGGKTWKKLLGDAEWTGVTDVLMDPRDPDRLYAATWQRHRTVAAFVGGGPESGIHLSTDGGESFSRIKNGLPEGNMGKIGLAISPLKPHVIYAAIETDRREGAVYRSSDRGASWEKGADAVGGGTGPHYYQELYASPHHFDWLYLVNNTSQISKDGGKTFEAMSNEHKHGDDHAFAFRPDDPDYLMVGSDGGLYETFDHTETWRYIANMPITQFYKVAVDDDEPFYNIYGGTQDNNSQGGPSQTDNPHGIRNSDWFITLFGDGHQSATEPGNPDIVYAEWQQGNLVRYHRPTGQIVYIQPQGEPGDDPERFNWDSPILVSSHQPTRLYFASQRVWRSDDRGDNWRAISGDLTRNEERVRLPIMGGQQSWDSPWDMYAMSQYNSITSLAESALDENLLYAGTDDGYVHRSDDGGENWTRLSLPNVDARAFVNDIKADLHDTDTVYLAVDNHKGGDFQPYLFKSTDRGRRWTSIAEDLPDRHLVWRLVQDHVDPDLLFVGTEFGVFTSFDGGADWHKLSGDMPTIAVRDLAIQKRENDLVAATFGRGFYVLDDYSPLRDAPALIDGDEPAVMAPDRAWWYTRKTPLGLGTKAAQGHSFYSGDNPPFGAVISYYLPESLETEKKARQTAEKERREAGEDTPFIGWDAVESERREAEPGAMLIVRNDEGEVVRRVMGPAEAGFHRVAWDLRHPATQAIGVEGSYISPEVQGYMAAPGKYTVELASRHQGETRTLTDPVAFDVVPMRDQPPGAASTDEVVAFWKTLDDLQRETTRMGQDMQKLDEHIKQLGQALDRSRGGIELDRQYQAIRESFADMQVALGGQPDKYIVGQLETQTADGYLGVASLGTTFSTYGPTPTHRKAVANAEARIDQLEQMYRRLIDESIEPFEQALEAAGAPHIPGIR